MTILLALFLAAASATKWVREADLLQARSDMDSVIYGQWIFIGGGCAQNQTTTADCPEITNTFEVYDVLNDTWSSLPPLPQPRYRHECILVNDSIYFIAGRTPTGAIIQDLDIYNITSRSWRTVTQTVPLYSDGTAWVIGQKIYYTGGYDLNYTITSNETLLLDLTLGEQFQAGVVAEKTVHSGDLYSAAIGGLGYVFGGWSPDNNWAEPLNSLEVYNPMDNTWTVKQSFITPRGDMAGVVINDLLYIIGGESKDGSGVSYPIANVEVYTPSRDTWRTFTPIAESRFRFTSSAYKNVIYNIGGQLSLVSPPGQAPYYPVTAHVYSYDTSSASAISSFTLPLFIAISCLMTLL